MELLKPPTDNLYKFLALSGVLVLAVSIFYPFWQWYHIKERSIEVSKESEFLLADIDRMKTELESDLKTLTELQKEEEEGNYKGDPVERIQRLQQRNQQHMSLALESRKKSIELHSKQELLNLYSRMAIAITLAGVLGIAGGLGTAAFGFGLWYTRLQKYQDMILQKEAEKFSTSIGLTTANKTES